MLLFAALLILSQTSRQESVDVSYWAEVTIEGNKTLNVSNLLPQLNNIFLKAPGINIRGAEIAAECEIIGRNTTCWCGTDYVWSNHVCDTVNKCCNVVKCVANISDYTPLCLSKVNVSIFGIMTGASSTFPGVIEPAFRVLNAFSSFTMNGPIQTGSPNVYQHNFTVFLGSVFSTPKVQSIISTLLANPSFHSLSVTSQGMVHMETPTGKVRYQSTQQLNCASLDRMERCVWQISRGNEYPQTLGPGREVSLSCIDAQKSTVTLLQTTGFWSGTYSCLFVNGSITHMARAPIQIALLPEDISVTGSPASADCSKLTSINVTISCSIENSSEPYIVQLNPGKMESTVSPSKVLNGSTKYTGNFTIDCTAKQSSYNASCTVKNTLKQERNSTIKIPVIYSSDQFCESEVSNQRLWPKTKDGERAVLDCNTTGREGTVERKCTGKSWGEETSLCVKTALKSLTLQAANFEKGIGATQEIASALFENLKNNMADDNTFGDVKAAVSVFQTMENASAYIPLGENLLPDFIDSASSMLSVSWGKEMADALATQYLSSVEGLVNRIRINNSDGYNSTNIQLQICRSGSDCNTSVFDVGVSLNVTADMIKTLGMQDLSDRLPKHGYGDAVFPCMVVSTTVENVSSPTVNIRLAFQTKENLTGDMHCVFWNITDQRWSTQGCEYIKGPGNISYCECNHFTSFTVLMSRHPVRNPSLEVFTCIGLGISICSLILYIIIEGVVWKAVVKSSLSYFRHTALINISLCLLLAHCSFVLSLFPSIRNDTVCLVLVLAKHYFFLAMFFWMFCLSIMLVHQLIFVFSHVGKKVYMIIGFTIGYIGPTVTVAVTYVYYSQDRDVLYYNTTQCWLTYKSAMVGSIYAFIFPVGTIVLVNMFSMAVVIMTVLKPSGAEAGKTTDKDAAKAVIKVILFLTPVFGGTWVLGFFVFFMDSIETSILKDLVHYAFTVVNSLQGFFILLTGCFAEKTVRDEILRIVWGIVYAQKSVKDHSASGK